MKKCFIAGMFVLATMASVSVSQAAEVTLCTGKQGGNYDSVMRAIGIELQNQGHTVAIKNLKGSESILNALNSGECAYGPAQKDVHYNMTKKNASLSSTVTPISLLYNEAMTAFCTSDSGIDELEEIDSGTKIIVDSIGSGSALSWETMVSVEKEYGNGSDWIEAQVSYTPLDEAVAALSLGEADCAFGVGAVPINWARSLDSAGMNVVWLYDKDLNDLTVGKSSLYPATRVPYGAYSSKFDTYMVPAVLFRSNKAPKDDQVDSIVKRLAPSIGQKYNTVK